MVDLRRELFVRIHIGHGERAQRLGQRREVVSGDYGDRELF